MTTEELIQAWRTWGKDMGDMVRIRKRVLQKTSLPEETKLFLNQAGLAEAIYYGMIKPNLPRLTELVSETGPLPASFARYRVLGEMGYHMFHCLDEEKNGQVVVVIADSERENQVFFYNSSIQHYAECCVVTGEVWDVEIEQGHASFPSPAWDKFVAKYEQAIRAIDPPALANERTLYARKIANLKEGAY